MDNLKDEVTKKIGEEAVEENPFVTSEQFLALLKATAAITRTILMASRGPGEAVNAIMSIMVTMLRNVPNPIWERIKENVAKETSGIAKEGFDHMDAIRSYAGDERSQFVEFTGKDESIPSFNAPPPNKPC